MPRKRHKPEEIVAKLRQVDVLASQGQSVADAVRSIVLWIDGVLAVPFWAGVVGLGLVVPLLMAITLLITSRMRPVRWLRLAPVVALTSCLVGGWLLRYVVLSAGLQASLANPYVVQAAKGLRFIP